MLKFVGKLAWGTTKLAIKYVVIPVAITAGTALALEKAAEKVRAEKDKKNVAVIRPEP